MLIFEWKILHYTGILYINGKNCFSIPFNIIKIHIFRVFLNIKT